MRTASFLGMVPSLKSRLALLERIRAEAKAQGITLGELAERSGVRAESLSRAGARKDVGYDTLWRLADVLGFDIGLVPRGQQAPDEADFDPTIFPGFKE